MKTRPLLFLLAALPALSVLAADPSGLHVIARYEIGGEGGYDYLKYEASTRRLFVAHGTKVEVLDTDTGRKVGEIAPTPGVHGTTFAPELGCGFTSNGAERSVTQFDLKTLATLRVIKYTGVKPDAILYDPDTKRVFVANGDPKLGGDLTVIDATAGAITGTVDLGGKLEDMALDGQGRLFVASEDRSLVHVVDSRGLKVLAHWPLAPGEEPTGMAIDRAHHRLFLACANKVMVVLDTDSGRVVATPAIAADPDGAAFDAEAGLAFASCREGWLSVIKQTGPDVYQELPAVPTGAGARTMALDAAGHRIFVPTGTFDPAGHRLQPGSFAILVVGH